MNQKREMRLAAIELLKAGKALASAGTALLEGIDAPENAEACVQVALMFLQQSCEWEDKAVDRMSAIKSSKG